jgi:hypothetical protein
VKYRLVDISAHATIVLIAVLYFPVSCGREALPVPLLAAISLFSLALSPLLAH